MTNNPQTRELNAEAYESVYNALVQIMLEHGWHILDQTPELSKNAVHAIIDAGNGELPDVMRNFRS